MTTTTHTNTVQGMYIAYYGRPADKGGLDYWADRLDVSVRPLPIVTA